MKTVRSDKQLFKGLEPEQLKVVVKALSEMVDRDDFIHKGDRDEVYLAVFLHRKARSEYHQRISENYATAPSNGSPATTDVAGGSQGDGQAGLNV